MAELPGTVAAASGTGTPEGAGDIGGTAGSVEREDIGVLGRGDRSGAQEDAGVPGGGDRPGDNPGVGEVALPPTRSAHSSKQPCACDSSMLSLSPRGPPSSHGLGYSARAQAGSLSQAFLRVTVVEPALQRQCIFGCSQRRKRCAE